MKKTILLLLTFICLTSSASVLERTATFDFASPTELNPSIIPESSSGGVIPLNNISFTDGLITISFGRLTSDNLPAQIATYVNPYSHVTSYYLRINSGSVATVSGSGVVIKSIEFYADGDMGTFSPLKLSDSSEPGSVIRGVWSPGDSPVTSVSFSSNAKPSYISKMVVTYEQTSILLKPIDVSLTDGAVLDSFHSMSLSFESEMTVQEAADGIRLSGKFSNGDSLNVKPNISGNGTKKIVLSLDNAIDKDGTFEVTVPAQSFRDAVGYENIALHFKFTVFEPRDTFIPLSIDPDTLVSLTELSFPITLQFPDTEESFIGFVDERKTFDLSRLNDDDSWTVLGELKAVKGTNGEVKIEKVTTRDVYTTLGVYKIEVPDSVVFNQFSLGHASSRHNAAFELIYTVDEPADPLKLKKDSLSLLATEVDSLLANYAGKVGYPVSVDTLLAVTELAVTDTDDEASLTEKLDKLQGALYYYYNDPVVMMPTKDMWYTIASENKDGEKLYLTYSHGAVTLSQKASPFKISDIHEDVAVIETSDGKFLHVLMGADDYDKTSTKNVSEDKNYVNNLTLGKMLLPGDSVDQRPVAGLLTIKGSVGLDKESLEKMGDAYALVIHGNPPLIATSLKNSTLYFESDKTSAFRFAETLEPAAEVMAKAVIKSPKLTSNKQVMTLEILGLENDDDVTAVSLKSLTGVRFSYKDGDETKYAVAATDSILKPLKDSDNQFTVHVDGLADNTYELIMPAGTFDFSENPIPVADKDLKVSFTISTPPAPIDIYANYGSLPEMWGTIPSLIQGFAVADTALLEVYYYVTATDIFPNNDSIFNVVTLHERWKNTFIARGHFESMYRDNQYMLKIVYDDDTPLSVKLPLESGDYTLTIERAAYGDENFNKRQNGDTTIAESDCRVNQRVLYNNLTIDNSLSGIELGKGHKQLPDGKYLIDGSLVIVKNGKKFTATGIAI